LSDPPRRIYETGKEREYFDTPEYDKLVDLLYKQAIEDGRNMSDAEIHKSARNLMDYVEFMIKINSRNEESA